jgi:UDP-N-acetylglucosamine--N-acetylmuramyl-(pentapeptide) pyrophosphoryl-undecaprenol N-acetylglucosamine transferase
MKVLVSGGGTGGHIYPALSIIEEFQNNKNQVLYVGKKNSMESEIVPKSSIDFKGITIEGFNRVNKFKNLIVGIKLFLGLLQSTVIVLKFNPDVVIGTGGYVSGPVLLMASLLNKKTYIHEQNSFPGVTNRILSKYVDTVFISYEESANRFPNKSRLKYTGNPVRKDFKEKLYGQTKNSKNFKEILSFGGSGGAKKINNLMLEVIKQFNGNDAYKITHVTGKKYYEGFMRELKEPKVDLCSNIEIYNYLKEMPKYMLSSDLVISRAGAITISELKYTKTPSILIPSPNVTDDHQTHNAKSMENKGLAKMIKESELNEKLICDYIKSPVFIQSLKENLNNFNEKEASEEIYNYIMKDLKI